MSSSSLNTQSSTIDSQAENSHNLDLAKTNSKAMLRDEFLINMQKFSLSITHTIQQIEGEVRLEVPELNLSDNLEENLRNDQVMEVIQETCRGWYKQLTTALETQQRKSPRGNGPLSEIDYWRERNASLSALYEQLRQPRVKLLLDLYSHTDNAFEYLKQDLNKFYTEAKDNVRFLSTLERHFKNVTHGANFQVECLLGLLFIVIMQQTCLKMRGWCSMEGQRVVS